MSITYSRDDLDRPLEETDRPRTHPIGVVQARRVSRFERWALSPVEAYRVGLTITYIATIYFGISAFIAGVPVFELTAPRGWTPIWALVVILGGIAGTFGTFGDSKLFTRVELGGAWALFIALGTYAGVLLFIAYGTGDVDRAAAGAGFVVLGATPGVRLLWLMAQAHRRPSLVKPGA